VAEASLAQVGSVYQIVRWSVRSWPPREQEHFQTFPIDDHEIQVGFTRGGNLLVLRLGPRGSLLQTFQSQPLEFEGEGYVRIVMHWSREGIGCRFGSHDLVSLHECGEPARIVFKKMEVWPIQSYDAPERHVACEREVRLRSKRVHASGAEDRPLSLSEEIENLRDSVRAIGEDADRVRAGEKHRTNAVRAAIRELITDLGDSYRPLLFRVAGLLGLPLPVYAMPKGFFLPGLFPAGSGFDCTVAACAMRFSTERIIDFAEWLRRPMLLHGGKRPFTFDQVIAKSANFLGGAHSASSIPPEIDRTARTTIGGLSANTRFLLSVAAVVAELGQYMLRVVDTPEAERCTERAMASPAEAVAQA